MTKQQANAAATDAIKMLRKERRLARHAPELLAALVRLLQEDTNGARDQAEEAVRLALGPQGE
jgi:hypothetical protein